MPLYEDHSECPVCKRNYAHLDGCTVKILHKELDEAIKRSGASNVKIVEKKE